MTDSDSESFGTLPHHAEPFGNVPHDSERFGTLRHVSERKENHTLTVRETARLFEVAGVARTERSITNWCQPNKMGIARLDCYFDPNERKYFITPDGVRLAIEEERAKASKGTPPHALLTNKSAQPRETESRNQASFGKTPNDSEEVSELQKEITDLRIANRGKDMFIEHLNKERAGFIDQLMQHSHKIGVLETRLIQLNTPTRTESKMIDSTADKPANSQT